MRLLITGSRTWDDYDTLKLKIIECLKEWVAEYPGLEKYPMDAWLTIVHGNCPHGADMLADHFARTVLHCKIERYDADWSQYQKRAGFVRNQLMVNKGADVCLAFIRDKSKGATGCRDLAKKAGIATETFLYEKVK